MKILILGSDGYIGYPLTLHLLNKQHEVWGIDNGSRRRRVREIGGDSLTPIPSIMERVNQLKFNYRNFHNNFDLTLSQTASEYIKQLLLTIQPDCIVHLAEQPSAPWSMRDVQFARATQMENVIGTLDLLWAMKEACPDAHLVKIGTMGEYGTPECDIPEGRIPPSPCKYTQGNGALSELGECPMWGLLFPRSPGSFYHLTKVHDTYNIKFCCDTWGLRSTDIMQGVLFGVKVTGDETEDQLTRFDYDEYFGTCINRFVAQALIGHPLTVYGKGGQTRGYLPLKDSIQCLTIAIENPPKEGEYRTWNQYETIYSVNGLADLVWDKAQELEYEVEIEHISNPRAEKESHYYNHANQTLLNLGYKPTTNIGSEIYKMIQSLEPYKNRIIKDVIMPKTKWR